ncbi:hypothetical protein Tco_0303393 [Tanacetum coccineum]
MVGSYPQGKFWRIAKREETHREIPALISHGVTVMMFWDGYFIMEIPEENLNQEYSVVVRVLPPVSVQKFMLLKGKRKAWNHLTSWPLPNGTI